MRRLMFWKKYSAHATSPAALPTDSIRQDGTRQEGLRKAGLLSQLRWPLIKRAGKLGGVCLVAGLVMTVYTKQDALIEAFYDVTADHGLALSELHVKGRNFTSQDHILDAIDAGYGTPLLSLSLSDIKDRLEQIGWVESASVSRHYPDQLFIHLQERRPLALLQTTGGHRLIDQAGHTIFGADAADFTHLPVVAGKGAAEQAWLIIDALRTEPELFADVWAIHRISDRRWDVHLRTGLEVRLPEIDAALAWSKLAILDRDTKIMKRDLAMIDMRVSGQLIVEPNLPLSKKGQKT